LCHALAVFGGREAQRKSEEVIGKKGKEGKKRKERK
jgi:hypothetical protein